MKPFVGFNTQRSSIHIRLIAAIVVMVAIIWLGSALRHTLSCFLLSFVIAYLLDPLVVRLEKRLKRNQAIILLYLVLTVLSIFSATFILPKLTMNWDGFLRGLPHQMQQVRTELHNWMDSLPNQYATDEMDWFLDNLLTNFNRLIEKGGGWAYGFATKMFFNLFNIVLAPILVFFMLSYKQKIIETFKMWLPVSRRSLIIQIGTEIDQSVGGYIKGQMIVSTVVTMVTIPALLWLGVPNPFLCGILSGAFSILPFVGVILAMVPPLVLSWLTFGSGVMLVKIFAVYCVTNFFEGYLLKPLVFKESMNLNPLLTIVMVMALGELLGFWGVLLALPITAAILITSQHWLKGDFSELENEP